MRVSTTAGRRRGPRTPPALSLPGAASLGVRAMLGGPRRAARAVAVFPSAAYLRVDGPTEPIILALVTSDAVRPPNAVVLATPARQEPFRGVREGDVAFVGDGGVEVTTRLRVRIRRWWDPTPVLGPLSLARLAHGAHALGELTGPWGLSGHPVPGVLADSCADGDLAHAVDAAERIVGLGPGLTPSGDDALAGLLLALRLLGGAVPGGGRAVWLADWLGAAVTAYACERTTALAATLLQCAARGQASVETAAVLRGIAGQEPLEPAARRLIDIRHTSGADVAWGLLTGCRAALALSAPRPDADRSPDG
ncbi:oxamate carbamoyltransferase subunit AllH family protein [Actinoallomurus sp. CA-150999]|uniref:oxamate carbamoyltransferase subunit AllH family protein n=1 Tax=Actinoallomurus sp. CA-150999 TaxID=3239887 RepID=UPI003D8ED7F4